MPRRVADVPVRTISPSSDSINKMVNWHDPAVLLKDRSASRVVSVGQYAIDSNLLVAFIKLSHAIGGIYMYVPLH